MKLKCLPDDFQVEEQIAPLPAGGSFALYRLSKSSLGTPEAVDAILKKWNLPRSQAAYAGLKDRHALTTQFITIQGGPRRGLRQTNLELAYVGQVARPVHAKDIVANRFAIVLRDLSEADMASATQSLARIAADGLPNYFDSQRFGSLGHSGEFIARPWCLGDYERALWLALADPNDRDTPDERRQKQILADLWNQWPKCLAALAPSDQRNIVAFLADRPGDFKRALTLIRHDWRSIYLAAFQSDLWNRWLAALLHSGCEPSQLPIQPVGPRELPFYRSLTDEQRATLLRTQLPLPSARLHMEEGPQKELLDGVLAEEGIELRQVRLKFPRDTFFSKGERAAVFVPREVAVSTSSDELYSGQRKLAVRFSLPRGSYATILVKQVTGSSLADDEPAENV